MVGYAGVAHSAQINGVKFAQGFNAIFRQHFPVLQIVFAAPGKIGKVKTKIAVQLGSSF